MDAATVVAIVAAAISVTAMGISVWQGISAHRSAGTAKRQADSSQQAADAAERSAAAAEAGDDARQRTQDESDGPQFHCVPGRTVDQSQDVDVAITMLNGPRLKSVAVSAVGETTGVARGDRARSPFEVVLGEMGENDRYMVNVGLERPGLPGLITLHLDCVEYGGRERKWRRSYRLADMHQPGRS